MFIRRLAWAWHIVGPHKSLTARRKSPYSGIAIPPGPPCAQFGIPHRPAALTSRGPPRPSSGRPLGCARPPPVPSFPSSSSARRAAFRPPPAAAGEQRGSVAGDAGSSGLRGGAAGARQACERSWGRRDEGARRARSRPCAALGPLRLARGCSLGWALATRPASCSRVRLLAPLSLLPAARSPRSGM